RLRRSLDILGCPLFERVQRIVLDTCVIVAAFRSRNGASRIVLDWVADRLLVPLLTPALFLQYEDVLTRPEQLRASRLTPAQVERILLPSGARQSPSQSIIPGDRSCRIRATSSYSRLPSTAGPMRS